MNLFDFEKEGYYGDYGGAFVPEILATTIEELQVEFKKLRQDKSFWNEYVHEIQTYSGRPTPVTYLKNLSQELGGAQLYVKREDLNHTGSHKINNVIGQGLLTKRLGKKRIIAETGAGQHGVASATMAARFGLESVIYMGSVDAKRQRPNVFWMEKLGSKVVEVSAGQGTLKDAINEAMRDWSLTMDTTHYVLGTACGAHPFPEMVSYFQSIIGQEAREQIQKISGKLPTRVYACVGGGSNAMGIFQGFLNDESVELYGCEAGGTGEINKHAARLAGNDGSPGVAQGYKTYFLQNDDGNMRHTHSVAAGLDYIGVSPILSHLADIGRVNFKAPQDDAVIQAAKTLMRTEGLVPALESSHAFAGAIEDAAKMPKDSVVLINMSGRGDKDIFTFGDAFEDKKWEQFLKDKADGSL